MGTSEALPAKQGAEVMGLGKYKYVPLALSLISVFSLAICISTDYWYIVETSSAKKSNEGLWRSCMADNCKRFSGDIESWFQAVRAFLLLGMISFFVGIVFFFIAIRIHTLKVVYPSGFFVSCTLIVFSMVLYSVKQKTVAEKKLAVHFGYSYAIGWVSGTISLIASIMGYYDIRKRPVESTTNTTTVDMTASSDSLHVEIIE